MTKSHLGKYRIATDKGTMEMIMKSQTLMLCTPNARRSGEIFMWLAFEAKNH